MNESEMNINKTKIILLGTGTPNAFPERSGSSIAIIVSERPYLVDFGPGVIRRVKAASIDPVKIETAFLTHLHSDHTIGYPDLIFTPWVLGRKKSLEVYGPEGLKHLTEHIVEAFKEDIRERIEGLEPINHEGTQVNIHEISPGLIYSDIHLRVEAFPVNHGSWTAYGFKFYTPDKTIVISGDTAPSEELEKQAKGCDILIHEVYSVNGLRKRPKEWQEYHKNVHTSTHELAEIASRAGPELLILYHQLFWGISQNQLLDEIKERYDGKIISGNDLDVF